MKCWRLHLRIAQRCLSTVFCEFTNLACYEFADKNSEVKARAERTVDQFPQSLIYRTEDLSDPDANIEIIYARILVRLQHLQNLFFAERLLLRLGRVDDSRLLLISFEMVTLTLVFWTHQDRFAGVRRDFEWLVGHALLYWTKLTV